MARVATARELVEESTDSADEAVMVPSCDCEFESKSADLAANCDGSLGSGQGEDLK